ncbi:MAG: FtsX-like permease family protein [Nannocystaceae bacterium]
MSVFKMAWRGVWRYRRRSVVTMSAMTFALWVMILYSGLLEGYLAGMQRNAVNLELGDIQVFAPGYQKNPSLHTRIPDARAVVAALGKRGFPASARVLGGGLAATDEFSAAVSFRGVEMADDAKVTSVSTHVRMGNWLDVGHPRGVVIGRKLARILGVEVGEEFVVVSQGADGSMANELYAVRGVLNTIADVVDRSGVYMHADLLRELLVVPEGAHQIIVRRPSEVPLDVAIVEVSQIARNLEARTWRQLIPTLASLLDSTRGSLYAMFVIVYIAIGIVILNAMLMAVFERIREFGVLKALGVGPWDVMRIIWAEAIIETGIAIVAGVVLSIPALYYLSATGIDFNTIGNLSIAGVAFDPIWRAEINAGVFLGPVVTMLTIVALAVCYPAIKAAMIRPVEAMRHQ